MGYGDLNSLFDFIIAMSTSLLVSCGLIIYGINVKTLLNPRITLNTWLKLNNQDIKAQEIRLMQLQALLDMDGYYIVREITYNGDTRGNDWYSDIFASAQSGAIPTMMQDPFQFTR